MDKISCWGKKKQSDGGTAAVKGCTSLAVLFSYPVTYGGTRTLKDIQLLIKLSRVVPQQIFFLKQLACDWLDIFWVGHSSLHTKGIVVLDKPSNAAVLFKSWFSCPFYLTYTIHTSTVASSPLARTCNSNS